MVIITKNEIKYKMVFDINHFFLYFRQLFFVGIVFVNNLPLFAKKISIKIHIPSFQLYIYKKELQKKLQKNF